MSIERFSKKELTRRTRKFRIPNPSLSLWTQQKVRLYRLDLLAPTFPNLFTREAKHLRVRSPRSSRTSRSLPRDFLFLRFPTLCGSNRLFGRVALHCSPTSCLRARARSSQNLGPSASLCWPDFGCALAANFRRPMSNNPPA